MSRCNKPEPFRERPPHKCAADDASFGVAAAWLTRPAGSVYNPSQRNALVHPGTTEHGVTARHAVRAATEPDEKIPREVELTGVSGWGRNPGRG